MISVTSVVLAFCIASALPPVLAAPPDSGSAKNIPLTPPTITYDAAGIPFVSATDEASGYAGLCYAMAKDRLFQMDLFRRSAYGRLAEVFGPGPGDAILQQDLTLRVQDIATHAANRLAGSSTQVVTDLNACAIGVNKFIDEALEAQTLSPEFSVLQYTPDYWTAKDSVATLIYLGSGFSNIGTQVKMQRAALASVFGAGIAGDLIPAIPDDPSMFDAAGNYVPPPQNFMPPPSELSNVPIPTGGGDLSGFRMPAAIPAALAAPRLEATNSFAIDGTLSASGKPILANDPHLQLTTPSAFYFARLRITGQDAFDVHGATIAGAPIFLTAQNGAASWGISIAGVDDTDLYVESILTAQLNGRAIESVFYKGALVPVVVKNQLVGVAGQAAVPLKVRITPHGSILNDALPALNPFGQIAIKSTFMQPQWSIDGYFQLPRAANWSEFQSAVLGTGIGLNFVYADSSGPSGNIGYQLAGLVPQRNPENLYVPVSGSDGAHEWIGYASAGQHPSVLNPSNHFIVSANNRLVPSNYAPNGVPVEIGGFLEEPWRALRAAHLFYAAAQPLTTGDLTAMQLDTYDAVAAAMSDVYGTALQATGLPAGDSHAASSLSALQSWDGNASAGSKGALISEVMTALLLRDAVMGVVGPDFYENYVQGVFVTRRVDALRGLLANPHAPFFGIQPGDDVFAKRDAAIKTALAETDALLSASLGADDSDWTWGQLHVLHYNHPLSAAPIPNNPFALPVYPASGDFASLNIGWWGTQAGLLALPPQQLDAMGGAQAVFAQDALAAARVAWDTTSKCNPVVLSTGQSGNPFSPHWIDQAALWRSGAYVTLSGGVPCD